MNSQAKENKSMKIEAEALGRVREDLPGLSSSPWSSSPSGGWTSPDRKLCLKRTPGLEMILLEFLKSDSFSLKCRRIILREIDLFYSNS